MKKFNWKKLDFADSDGDHPFVPALCGFFYFKAGVHEVAKELADGIERYVEFVSLDALKSYVAPSGNWKDMTKRQFDKDLKHLRDFPRDHAAIHIEYDSGEGGEPGGFGVNIAAHEDDENYKKRASALRVDFPSQWLDEHGTDEFINFVSEIVQMPHVQSANVGFTFKSTSGSEGDAMLEVHKRLPRYFGFGPCNRHLRDEMLGHTFAAYWLNYLDDDLAAELGGFKTIAKTLAKCDVRKLKKGVLIRGAKLPPIGDINRKAPDLGCLPEVARLLKPTRLDIESTSFAIEDEDFDAIKWIERMDDMDSRPWDNSDAF